MMPCGWGARYEGWQPHREPSGALGVQAVRVFGRAYPGEQGLRVQVVRERELDEEPGDGFILVQALDKRRQLLMGSVCGEPVGPGLYTDLRAVGLLVAHVGDGGRVLPHQDHIEPYRPAPRPELPCALRDLRPYLRGGGFAVKDLRHSSPQRGAVHSNGAEPERPSLRGWIPGSFA
jgi:hypothetical protein